ncbi:hypothetical protein ACIQ9P_04215 [Kitasatospora sp. NPDC094019]|uniref:hypothetical protein n=1 Tax=Kitasatospora sp. NPDC094019 TaxID=3364091 RepID=UPI003815D366
MSERTVVEQQSEHKGRRGDRVVDLVAMLALLVVAAVIYIVAGPAGFSAVASAGGGFFVAWQGRR